MERPLIVDGGLATTLESAGYALHPRLWSAGVFLEHPEAVEAVHRSFLAAGAEILISASYQMSFAGLEREGLSHAAAAAAMHETVAVARRARHVAGARGAIVAASIGPYGAARADGSEYTGAYGGDAGELAAFHRERLEVLSASGADMLAVETIPSLEETRVLVGLLDAGSGPDAWLSFCCRDGSRLADGEPVTRGAELADGCRRVTAVGINCTAPEHVSSLIDELRRSTPKRIVVYPNSGERWEAEARCWSGTPPAGFVELARGWSRRRVWAIGGCCRIGPETIRELAVALGR